MKKEVLLKKIKNLRHRRASIYEKLQEKIKENSNQNSDAFPSVNNKTTTDDVLEITQLKS